MNRNAFAWILRGLLAVAVFTTLNVKPLQAQVDTGSITGTVTDTSGAVVSGAKVTLTNEGTGTNLSTATGADGVYEFSPVRIGSYKLDASAQGFKKELQIHVVVDVSARVLVNFKLQPGAVSETVEVTSTAPVLQSQDASVGQVVDQRSVNNLPSERQELHLPGPACRRREHAPGRYARERGVRSVCGQWQPAGAEQLHARWH